jgi:hypothetical protein
MMLTSYGRPPLGEKSFLVRLLQFLLILVPISQEDIIAPV